MRRMDIGTLEREARKGRKKTRSRSSLCALSALCVRCVQYTFPMPQFIYTMKGLGKVHPPDTKVLEDIWLSFYYGAKIGVLGLNGAGKSSLLKIMAGGGTRFLGEGGPPRPPPPRVLPPGPQLNPAH